MFDFTLSQSPPPGSRRVCSSGQRVRIELLVRGAGECRAFVRTTIGRAEQHRKEVIAEVELGRARPGAEWHDLEMTRESAECFAVELALEEVGVFESRCYVLRPGSSEPLWPVEQGNAVLKVQPAWTGAGCGIYGAFPRLFQRTDAWRLLPDEELEVADKAGWTMIPPSGKLRDVGRQLPHIVDRLGFRIILLPPIFPTPTTYARMGRYGSPFAPVDFYAVDPALAEFDRHTTPLEQMAELTDAIHSHGARVFVDVPINHTGWASRMQTLHPEWFKREDDGAFKSPGAWGVVWEDLVELTYDDRALWREMAEVFLFWCREGIDGFRCDAGYMLPTPVWEYITAKVRREFPETVFLLEGLGGPVPKTLELLDAGGLDWAYSELFQNYHRGQVEWYLGQAMAQTDSHGLQVHFAETHDNSRLAARGRSWALMRCALSALCSPNGAWAITAGVEWLASEKIDVHGCSVLNWGKEPGIADQVASLNALLAQMSVFHAGALLQILPNGGGETLALRRVSADGAQAVLVLVNLEPEIAEQVAWPESEARPTGRVLWASGTFDAARIGGSAERALLLQPGEVVCLEVEAPQAVRVRDFISDAPVPVEADCQHWSWPMDARRVFPWLPGRTLVLEVPGRFRYLLEASDRVVACGFGQDTVNVLRDGITGPVTLKLARFQDHTAQHSEAALVALDDTTQPLVRCTADGPLPQGDVLHAVLTNGRGAMSHVRASWGTVLSQYDALLAANLDERWPVQRRMLLTRCRAWVVRRGFSTEICAAWLKSFTAATADRAVWHFELPVGEGKMMPLHIELQLHEGRNAVSLRLLRLAGCAETDVSVILRPDVEDRGFYEKTALTEEALRIWAETTAVHMDGCDVPLHAGLRLKVRASEGAFHFEPERLTVGHPEDADRGQGASSDLYSPGFFKAALVEGQTIELGVTADDREVLSGRPAVVLSEPLELPMAEAARRALRQFMVKRDEGLTVIAGYPWFLDWGRDTLIALRGIIAAGWLEESREILKTFAGFEERGTLPNLIHGENASNRDTSDAPLWFFVAVGDLLEAEHSDAFLDVRTRGRTIREVMLSIAQHYIDGTPNGIRMDAASGLIYSPPHYTWMDTNYPAGTPREGYPICIQAKWHLALKLLARVDGGARWAELADRVRASIAAFYTVATGGRFLSDCLHGGPGTPAALAVADDHLRPNQLLAITLGAVDPAGPLAANVVKACEELLIPGGIRTLADRPVKTPLPVSLGGHLLNDPLAPFWPQYRGDEDTRRKPAYHNGTAWPWPGPSCLEAMLMVRGASAEPAVRALLAAARPIFEQGCLGHLPEITDGAAPHQQRGCGAQAWSVSEWLRVWALVSSTA